MSLSIIEAAKEELAEALKTGDPEKAKRALDLLEEAFDKKLKEIELEKLRPVEGKLERHQEKIAEVEVSLRELIEMTRRELRMGFEAMEKRFEAMEKRFEAMEKRFELLKEGQNRLWTFILWWVPFWIGVYTAILKFLIFK